MDQTKLILLTDGLPLPGAFAICNDDGAACVNFWLWAFHSDALIGNQTKITLQTA